MQHLTFRILEILQNKNGIFFIIMTRVIPCMQLISWFAYSWIWWCQVDLEHSSVVILWSQLECPLNMEACSPIIVKKVSPKSIFFPVRESGFWNPKSRRMFKWNPESWALQSGIQLKESGIQVPLTKTENQESWTAWNPRLSWISLHGLACSFEHKG